MSEEVMVKFTNNESKKIYNNGALLNYISLGASGFDLRVVSANAQLKEDKINYLLPAGKRCLVKTGICVSIPLNTEIQVRPRSGLALKNGITIVNTPGTVDSDYRGEVGVILLNTSEFDFEINLGERIAQAVLCPVLKAKFNFVDELDLTQRADGGFGSTGIL